jgi:hypothetical protein
MPSPALCNAICRHSLSSLESSGCAFTALIGAYVASVVGINYRGLCGAVCGAKG